MRLTIAYITARKEPKFEWFWKSLCEQAVGRLGELHIIVVDSLQQDRPNLKSSLGHAVLHTEPKPTVWQGKHRLTRQDWFAAANARNTALCLAPDGYIAFVDDLSVLMPGWLDSVKTAIKTGYIVCGSYRKVNKLVVEGGLVKDFEASAAGEDGRRQSARHDVVRCPPNWLYGCSVGGLVNDFLSVNGWPEALCDGLGMEDQCMGFALHNRGYVMRYDKRMLTWESEELHHAGEVMRREDFHFEDGAPKLGGTGGNDKSHAALDIAMRSRWFEQDFGGGFKDISALRKHVLKGGRVPD